MRDESEPLLLLVPLCMNNDSNASFVKIVKVLTKYIREKKKE